MPLDPGRAAADDATEDIDVLRPRARAGHAHTRGPAPAATPLEDTTPRRLAWSGIAVFVVGVIALAFALLYEEDLTGTQEEVVFITTWTLVLVGPVMAAAGAIWLQRTRRGRA